MSFWQESTGCTTCYACDQECPLFIENVTPVVDIRHKLVIDGRTGNGLQAGRDYPARGPGLLLRCIWMEEGQVTERPSESRIREAVAVNGVEVLMVACPKDVTMHRDAVKATGYEDKLQVKDLIELVHEAM